MRQSPTGPDADAPLWRAAQVFRLVTVAYAVGSQFSTVGNYTRPGLSWFFVGVLVTWSLVSAVLLSREARLRRTVTVVDQILAVALMAATRLVADHDWYSNHQTMPTTLWVANAVLSAAILGGPLTGIGSALLMSVVSAVVRDQINLDLWRDATAPVLVACGVAMGFATTTARSAHRQLEQAVRVAAATEERDRLARQVHDGVLQVLALVQRRGGELGGGATELAELAREQETALRQLISEQDTDVDRGGQDADLTALVRARAGTTATVSAPADPIMIPRDRAEELAALTTAALSNTQLHAGAGAAAYILLEDLGDEIVLSIRDDGVGIAPGRLDEAREQGRMGVSKSIVGRAEWLGGVALLDSDVGEGTEWEIRVPKGE
ncbi:ATP-binding protein [Rhodococcus rhodochrous]|uniref:MacS family sensor histidine kinase n=1 Tax=Rhodococcus rhodochrous TaxID=1829 RepID=UPI0013219258|nr:ATP-binding protein [Rhodococcus rhodochrous]